MGRYSPKEAAQLAKRASEEPTPHEVTGITVAWDEAEVVGVDEQRPSSSFVGRLLRAFKRQKASA